jgi:hypothetical protein
VPAQGSALALASGVVFSMVIGAVVAVVASGQM